MKQVSFAELFLERIVVCALLMCPFIALGDLHMAVSRVVVSSISQSLGEMLYAVELIECNSSADASPNIHLHARSNNADNPYDDYAHTTRTYTALTFDRVLGLSSGVTYHHTTVKRRKFRELLCNIQPENSRKFNRLGSAFFGSTHSESSSSPNFTTTLVDISLQATSEICSVVLHFIDRYKSFSHLVLATRESNVSSPFELALEVGTNVNDRAVLESFPTTSTTPVALSYTVRQRKHSILSRCNSNCPNVDCNDHGSVIYITGNCRCDCDDGWQGLLCATTTAPTPPPTSAPPTPAPPVPCTNADCNNHATTWSGTVGSCTCTCDPAWTDGACSTSNVCTNADCSGNAASVTGNRPSCACTCNAAWTGSTCAVSNVCTNAADCNNRATSFSGNRPNCICTCPGEWIGSACETSNVCTNPVDCSGQATSVSGNRPSCSCACAPEWTGASCQTSNVCTNDADCTNHAMSVSGNRPSCTCYCPAEWVGSACQTSNVCTNSADCSNHATSFSGNRPSCSCSCPPEWIGRACETSNVCTIADDCSGHATTVSGNRPSCTCMCPPEWIGTKCETSSACTIAEDCSSRAICVTGRRWSCNCECFPQWTGASCLQSNMCTIAGDCSGHGTNVSGIRPSCTCTCPPEWIGTKCEISNVCTSAVDCNNRAGRVVGNRPACTCYCLAAYHGKTCDVTYTLTATATHSLKPTADGTESVTQTSSEAKRSGSVSYTRSVVDLSPTQTSSETWTRSTSITQRISKSVISDSQSKSGSLLVSLTTTPSYSNGTTVSTSPTKTSIFTSSISVTRSSSISRSSTQATESMRATTTEMGSATYPSESVTLSFRETRDGNFFFVNGSDDPNGPQNHHLGGASVSLSRSWTHPGNLSISASLRKSPTVTVSPSCTSNVHLAIRASQELLSTEAELWCGGTAVGGVSSVGNGVNVSDKVVSESNTTSKPASCIVVPTASHGGIKAQISRTTMASMVPPLKLIIPFTLNATDWDVERYTTTTPTVDAATLNISTLSVQWQYNLLPSTSAVSNVSVNDSLATAIVLGNIIGAVAYHLDAIPAYSTVHAVVLRCQCGGRPVTTVFTVQWPDKVVLMTPAQEVLAGLATPLGPLSGDPTAAASMALMGAMSCSGEPITSASVAAYFISVFVDYGPASLALGNLGLAAAFCLLHAGASAVYYHVVMKSDNVTTESLHSSTASNSDDHANNGCIHEELKVAWWVHLCGAVRGPAWSVLFVQFMLPGAVYGSLVCLSSGDSIGLGSLALFLVIVVFVAHYLALTRLVLPNAVYVEYAIPQPTGSWLEMKLKMLPESKWLSYPLVRGFGPLMASRCREYCVMTFSDLFLSCLLAVATGLGVGTKGSSCSYAPLVVALVYYLYAAALVVLRPHRIPTDKLLAPMISTTYGVMCVLKYTESDSGACGTLLSVLQITQMILRMWVMFREQQWQRIEQEEEEERERIRLSLLMLEGDECTGKDELHVNDLLSARASDGSSSVMGGALVDIRDSGIATYDETSAAVVEVLFWDENGVAVGMNGTSVVSDDDATRHDDANESFDGELIMTNREKMMREQLQLQQNSTVVYGAVFDRRLRLDAPQKKQGKQKKSSMFSLSSYL